MGGSGGFTYHRPPDVEYSTKLYAPTLQHYFAGAGATIGVSVASIIFATILALFGAIARLSSNSVAQGIAGFMFQLSEGPFTNPDFYYLFGITTNWRTIK